MRKTTIILIIVLGQSIYSQTEMKYNSNSETIPAWAVLMYSENPDEGEVIANYTSYFKTHSFTKNKHTQYYKRWLRNLSRTSNTLTRNPQKANKSNFWECVGPWDFDKEAASRSYAPGSAHAYTVEQSYSNPNVLYTGTATAGAWKSTDKGDNWTLITQDLSLNQVYALEIDFLDDSIVYISGNGGIYKSYNSGTSWSIIGDITFTSLNHSIKDIKLKPTNNLELFVASDEGLYHSYDGGNNFNLLMSGEFLEIEFHPISADTIYFVKKNGDKTEFYRSDDGGTTLTLYTNGWPNPPTGDQQKRTEIAVSIASPNKIVALATGNVNGGSGLYGIYISYDKGTSWTFQCCGPQEGGPASTTNINMMGWADDGTDDGGQYYYDLGLALNPTDSNIIHVGGVQHWISYNNGVSFTCPAKWSHPHKKEYVHADIHDINYFGNDLWFACDGGIFYSDNAGDSIYKKMFGISGTDFWGFGSGYKDSEVMLGGAYHNGTMLKNGNTYINDWICTDGGDGIRGFVNYGDPTIAYSDYGGKILSNNRTIPISTFSVNKLPNASYIIGESSQFEFDPRCYNWIYSGNDTTLWLSKNNGKTYQAIHHFNDKVTSIEVAWSNPDVIYVATWPGWWDTKRMYRSDDAGQTWTEITINPSILNGNLSRSYDITVSSYDEHTLWAARCSQSGNYANVDGYKIFKSVDGGQNWINISTSTLDGHHLTNIEHQRGSNGGVYLGTRNSVFYKNDNMNDWIQFDNNLPLNTLSTQLILNYRNGILLNGTNRSAYKIDLYEHSPPSAQISCNRRNISCLNDTIAIQFVDHSSVRFNSATWLWSFPGGNPSSSTLENPIVYYNQVGSYDVSLSVTDAYGTSSQTIANFINYTDSVSTISSSNSYSQDFESGIFPPTSWELQNSTFSWQSIDIDTAYDCNPSTVAYVNHYQINQLSDEAYLISNKIKLDGGSNAQNYLTYDYAYSGYSSQHNDGFRVDISTNCGISWTNIHSAFGSALQTTGYLNSSWIPSCGSWAKDTLDLTSLGYNGDTILLRFVAINDYGNNFYMDNININNLGILNIDDINKRYYFNIYPNPSSGLFYFDSNIKSGNIKVISILGKEVYTSVINNNNILDLSKEAKGIYIIKIKHNGETIQKKITLM